MNDLIVAKLDRAALLLAVASTAAEAKRVADLACAAEIYARRQKLSADAIEHATKVKIDAMTLMGEFLSGTPKAKPTGSNQHKKQDRSQNGTAPPTLAALGISKKESSDGQALASLAKEEPAIQARVRGGELTIAKARREVPKKKRR